MSIKVGIFPQQGTVTVNLLFIQALLLKWLNSDYSSSFLSYPSLVHFEGLDSP
jgi:hypothetical protein